MEKRNVYFDSAASTKVRDEAIRAMCSIMDNDYGNPSSMHSYGRNARKKIENARENIANAIGSKPDNIYFTSGGTEANNWAIFGAADAHARKGKHIITSAIEHSAVLDPIKKLKSKGWEVTYLMPDQAGCITTEAFSGALREDSVFASIMLVNNETGVINPVSEYSKEIEKRGYNTILHTDAIQGLCKIPFTVKSLGADLITISSHKIHGPKGVGALYIGDGVKITPFILGGSHEKGNRGGTEALPAAIGFGEAAKLEVLNLDDTRAYIFTLKTHLIDSLKKEIPEAVFIGNNEQTSPYISCISLPGYKSEVLMNYLDGEGICVSRGSACKKGARSHTLEAMRLKNNVIDGSLRISFSRYNTIDEVDYLVRTLKKATETIMK